jgi:hypothetical protein
MNNQKNDIESIREYIRAHEEYFSSPEGLGWKRPGGLPEYYAARREEWSLDLAKVERLKREQQEREKAAVGNDRTASAGMSQEARCLLDSIRSLAGQGHPPKEIASRLGIVELGVRNVLAMGPTAYDPEAQAPICLPELETFRRSFGRSW